MPTWTGVLDELRQLQQQKVGNPFDVVRRKYLSLVAAHTGRPTMLYATDWTGSNPRIPPELISIVDEDLQGIMTVIHGLQGTNLDLILHSPGGSLTAAEAMVLYLRSKFHDIRVIVPMMAMSAATMIACAGDRILMGKHSFLGPIDPQLTLNTPLGDRMVPAQAILEQFELAKNECQDPSKIGAWLPMLSQYGPDILVQCDHANHLSEEIVRGWLETYMFKNDPERSMKANDIARWLSTHGEFKTHGRHIPRDRLEQKGLRIERLEDDETAQDLFLSIIHATSHTFGATSAVKIIENHEGKAFIKQIKPMVVPMPAGPGGTPPSP